jgi:hypothetical protein
LEEINGDLLEADLWIRNNFQLVGDPAEILVGYAACMNTATNTHIGNRRVLIAPGSSWLLPESGEPIQFRGHRL